VAMRSRHRVLKSARATWGRMPSTRRIGALLIGAAATAGHIAFAKDIVPLKRGYYVDVGTPCNNASNSTLNLFFGRGFRNCTVLHLQRTGTSYRITESCLERDETNTYVSTYKIISNTRYTVTTSWSNGSGGGHFRYCEQSTLPEPWRSNDITDTQDKSEREPVAAAPVAQLGTKQAGWMSNGANDGVIISGFADDGYSSISFSCDTSTHTIAFNLDPRGYRGHALRKVLELDQPFILEVLPVSGENEKFPLIAYMAGDGVWTQTRERGLMGSRATAFLDAFSREGRLTLQTGNGVELASWTLKGMSKARELMRNGCQL
jgi:hypothetical protein